MTDLLAAGGIGWLEILTFVGFIGAVITVSLVKSRKEESSEDYFLAGRKLTWWLIGFSLIASNISTEQFVGMNGSAFSNFGLAVASYEWMSAIVLVLVAWFFLPKFLKAGIYTMPEYLEYRYDKGARTVMAAILMFLYVAVFLATVLWSGATYLVDYFQINVIFENKFNMDYDTAMFYSKWAGVWAIAIVGAAYTIFGGLGAVVWADLIQGSALLIGGCIITFLGLAYIGDGSAMAGWQEVIDHGASNAKMDVVRPWNDPHMSWIAIFIGGMWIPNIFYWGLNQFITQRTLGAKSVHEGQKGILFAAFMKLLMPIAVAIPGVLAFYLVETEGNLVITNKDLCYSSFMRFVLQDHGWLVGLMIAAICGAVMSSFNAGINSASTVFTMDLYSKYFNKNADGKKQLKVGRIAAVIIVLVACVWTPLINKFDGVFSYIQEIWGFISPGIVAVFIVGMISKRVPRGIAKWAIILGVVLYGACRGPGWYLESQFPMTKQWMDEKSLLLCDKDYADKKWELVSDKNFKRDFKRAAVFEKINGKFRRNITRSEEAKKNFTKFAVEKLDQAKLNELTNKAYTWINTKGANGKNQELKDLKFSDDPKKDGQIRTALVYAYTKYFAPNKFTRKEVLDANGKPVLDANGKPKTVKKNYDDYLKSDLVDMAFVYGKGLMAKGFNVDSDLSLFSKTPAEKKAFLDKVRAGNTEAINQLAGYTTQFPDWGFYFSVTFLHHMLFVCIVLIVFMLIAGVVAPNKEPITMPTTNIDAKVRPSIYITGILVIAATVAVYAYFFSITK